MRPRFHNQTQFQFQAAPTLKITECDYGRYDRIDTILVEHPELIDLIHRVIEGRQVPNDRKLFSIFEPHTELLIRGKAGKPIEFGHMIQIQQVDGKFITHYDVFPHKPIEHELVEPVIE